MAMYKKRREAIQVIGKGLLAAPLAAPIASILPSCSPADSNKTADAVAEKAPEPWSFDISLAQWSLHKSFLGDAMKLGWDEIRRLRREDPDKLLQGELDPHNFPNIAKQQYDINAIELVNTFYASKGENNAYWNDFKNRCNEVGVTTQLIMCDGEGNLGDADEAARITAVENHYKWVNAAKTLGCHSIRVNAAGNGTAEEVKAAAVDGLGRLSEYAAQSQINVIVENHGGYSSDGKWLKSVMDQVNLPNCGTLPDFGNFCIERGEDGCTNEYDRYIGVEELMPYAKGVSAKSHTFNEAGDEVNTDYSKMLGIVKSAGYSGFIGIEYEGQELSEDEGIRQTKALLERLRTALA